jgi:hypothetical protein
MSKLIRKKHNFPNANNIRTNLLIYINKELKEKNQNTKNLLINSKPLETYCNTFENYVIVERDIIANSQKVYKKLKEKDELPLYLVKLNLKENSPIIETKKVTLTKNPDFFSQRSYSQNSDICEMEINKKKIEYNIRYLREFCFLLKSKTIIGKNKTIERNKSLIIRRKKFHIKDSNKKLKDLLNKNNVVINKKKEENYNVNDKNIIHLHKMWGTQKNVHHKKNPKSLVLLKSIKENKSFLSNLIFAKDDLNYF